jgi:DNA-binding response OmpR family regulator
VSSAILVIEDDPDIALAITTALSRGGFDVVGAADGRSGLREFHERHPALVLLDIGLPALDGWQVLERIRDLSDTPVLMLTAHGHETDKVRGLQSGADDYLAKPFGNAELLARIQALLRRVPEPPQDPGANPDPRANPDRRANRDPRANRDRRANRDPGADQAPPPDRAACYDDGFLQVDQGSCDVAVAGRAVALTPTEFRLLSALIRHRGQVLSPSQLLELAWNDPGRVGPERVKFSIMRLRRKLGAGGQEGSPIEAVRGFGYRYLPPSAG